MHAFMYVIRFKSHLPIEFELTSSLAMKTTNFESASMCICICTSVSTCTRTQDPSRGGVTHLQKTLSRLG